MDKILEKEVSLDDLKMFLANIMIQWSMGENIIKSRRNIDHLELRIIPDKIHFPDMVEKIIAVSSVKEFYANEYLIVEMLLDDKEYVKAFEQANKLFLRYIIEQALPTIIKRSNDSMISSITKTHKDLPDGLIQALRELKEMTNG